MKKEHLLAPVLKRWSTLKNTQVYTMNIHFPLKSYKYHQLIRIWAQNPFEKQVIQQE